LVASRRGRSDVIGVTASAPGLLAVAVAAVASVAAAAIPISVAIPTAREGLAVGQQTGNRDIAETSSQLAGRNLPS